MIKLGIIQTRQYGSNESAMTHVTRMLRGLAKKEADIVCLPEQWLANNIISDFEAQFSAFGRISKYSMAIIPGAFYEKSSHGYICAPVIDSGAIIGRQEKIHPFDYERQKIRHGTKARVFKTQKARIGVIICYDVVFPKVAETMAKKGAEVLFSPSRIVRRGIMPWHTYVHARSLENRIPVLAANMHSAKFGGKSIIVDLEEDDGVMIPKSKTLPDGQSSVVASFCLSGYKRSRLQRYRDKKRFS